MKGERRDKLIYQFGVNQAEVPRSHVILEMVMPDYSTYKLTVGDWLDLAFAEPKAGLHEDLNMTVVPHLGTFTVLMNAGVDS